MIHQNPTLRPNLFPEQALELFEQSYAIPGVSEVFEKMQRHHEITANHMATVGLIAATEIVGCRDRFEGFDADFCKKVVVGALLHDIGKGHPDITPLTDVRGEFTKTQRASMGLHPRYGAEYLSRHSAIRSDDGLVPDEVFLHHADSTGVDSYIAKRRYDIVYARKLRAGMTIISIADVVEATLPIGDENSHSTYGNRELPLEMVEQLFYVPLLDKLPDVDFKEDALAEATAYAQRRVDEYQLRTTVVF